MKEITPLNNAFIEFNARLKFALLLVSARSKYLNLAQPSCFSVLAAVKCASYDQDTINKRQFM